MVRFDELFRIGYVICGCQHKSISVSSSAEDVGSDDFTIKKNIYIYIYFFQSAFTEMRFETEIDLW